MTELSTDYLKAFHRFVKGHAMIYDQIKAEVHKRARGSAGGTAKAKRALEGGGEDIELEDITEHLEGESSVKVTNAAQMQGDYIETDEYIDAPTVFAKEGVFTGTNGKPTKKVYEVLKANVPRFLGASATPDHIETDTLRPSDRWLGHAVNVTARDDKRDIFGYTRYYKNSLNPDELDKIKNKQYPDGSIGYFTDTKDESGVFNGEPYEAVEVGPYIISEYATFFNGTKGACSREMGCGPFQNARGKKKDEDDDKLVLDKNGKVTKCSKKKNEADQMTEEMEKKFNTALEEINALKAELEKLKNAAPVDIKPIETKIADLETKFANKAKIEDEAKDISQKAEFKKSLNAAAATEIDTLWPVVKSMNPIEYEGWKFTNSSKLLTEAEKKAATGKKMANADGDIVSAARAKADATLFKRR